MAAVEGDVFDLLFADDGADFGASLFKGGGGGVDFDGGGDGPDLKLGVENAGLADGEDDGVELGGREAVERYGDGIGSDGEAKELISAVNGRLDFSFQAISGRLNRDGGAGEDSAGRISYDARKGSAVDLGQ